VPHLNIYNPSIWEAEAGGSRVQGQPGLYSKPVFKNKTEQYVASFYFDGIPIYVKKMLTDFKRKTIKSIGHGIKYF
jgi:hypothetical protein